MYVVCNFDRKGRNSRLQGNVIDVTFMLQSSFFCLETKERSKEKFKAYFFLLLASYTPLKGRNSLRSNSLPFFTLRYGSSLDGEKSRPGETMRMEAVIGAWVGGLWGCWVLLGTWLVGLLGVAVIGVWVVGLWVAGCYLNKASYIGCIALGWRGFRAFFF